MIVERSIRHLANYYNMSVYSFRLPPANERRDYLLEWVKPWAKHILETTFDWVKIPSRYLRHLLSLVSSGFRVNPSYIDGAEDSMNAMDARWIDTTTGLYIDVTTLRVNYTARRLGNEKFLMVSTSTYEFI
jgi:hypothetical protein